MAEHEAATKADFAPENLHNSLLERAPRILAFDAEAYFPEWQSAVRRSFKQLLGLMPEKVGANVEVFSDKVNDGPVRHRAVRFLFTAEPEVRVPCTLVLPAEGSGPVATWICLQGHRSGAHVSLGEARETGDAEAIAEGEDFAMQAVKRGFGALGDGDAACFGERKDQRGAAERMGHASGCQHAAMAALMVGRTMMGERVWDVVRSLDVLAERFPEVDSSRIGVMGFSVGGTVAYYAAAVDQRISAVAAVCGVGMFADSIGRINHCCDAYIPNVMHYFEMSDIAGLIVPRSLVLVAGDKDPLFPIAGVKESFAGIEENYRLQGASEKSQLTIGDEGHRTYPRKMWTAIEHTMNNPVG